MTISNLSPDTEYTFSIRAYDAKGNESEAATLQTRTNDNTVGDVIMTGVGNIAAGMSTEFPQSVGTEQINLILLSTEM